MSPLSLAIIVFTLVVMYFSISLHDMAQAWMANRLGDPTAKMQGRMTMNPLAHFDAWGMGISPLLTFFWAHSPLPLGWSQPVPMTYRNFHSKNGERIAILAGPTAQLLAAVISLVILLVLKHTAAGAAESLQTVRELIFAPASDSLPQLPGIFPVMMLLYLSIMMNLVLMGLNILPFPFFDGGRLLVEVLPYNAAKKYAEMTIVFSILFMFLARPLTYMIVGPVIGVFDAVLMSL